MIRPSTSRISRPRALTGAIVMAAAIPAFVPVAAHAVPVACSETALVRAVDDANAAGGGTLNLAAGCTYTLTSSHGNAGHGPVGLPIIRSVITIEGAPSTITRSNGILGLLAPTLRIAEVAGSGNLTLKAVTFDNGLANGSGGGILNYGAVTLTGSRLTNNRASGVGGGLANVDTPSGTAPAATFTSATVSDNTASGRGGGLYNGVRGTMTMTSSSVTRNRSTGAQGGGIAAVSSTATTLTSTPVTANRATGAGGIFRLGGVMTLTTSPISANTPNNCVGSVPAVDGCTA
jgi:hypothetical protein